MKDNGFLTRRRFLAASAAGTTAVLAGCSSSGSSASSKKNNSTGGTTTGGPAQLAHISFTGPSKVTVGESFRLTLNATNIGGQPGEITAPVKITEGERTFNTTLSHDSIDPGKTVSLRTKPIQFSIADDYTFAITGTNLAHTVSVQPKTGDLGTSFKVSNSLRATVQDISFQPSVFYTVESYDETHTKLQSTSREKILAILHISLENIGTKSVYVGGDSFQVPAGKMLSALGNGTPLTAAQLKGKPLVNLRLSSAEQREGWLLAQVPRSKARKSLAISYQRDGPGTPPEFQWIAAPDTGKRTYAQFSLKELRLPNSVELGQDATATVAVTNTGKETGMFRGIVEYRSSDSEGWQPLQPIKARIQSGKTARKQFTISHSSTNAVTYRLVPFGTTKTVEYIPPVLPFGKSYKTTENVKITVSNFQSAKSVRLVEDFPDDPRGRVPAPSGKRYVLVRVQSVVTGDSEATPFADEFSLRTGSQPFEKATDLNQKLVAPVESKFYEGAYNPDVGATYSGVLVWTVPKKVPLGNLTVQWQNAQGETAQWTKGDQKSSR